LNAAGVLKRSTVIRSTPAENRHSHRRPQARKFLTRDFRRIFGSAHDDDAERLGSAARATIECLARSDALYHNYEHMLQVTIVGCDAERAQRMMGPHGVSAVRW
jgi:hypothetical protein